MLNQLNHFKPCQKYIPNKNAEAVSDREEINAAYCECHVSTGQCQHRTL